MCSAMFAHTKHGTQSHERYTFKVFTSMRSPGGVTWGAARAPGKLSVAFDAFCVFRFRFGCQFDARHTNGDDFYDNTRRELVFVWAI